MPDDDAAAGDLERELSLFLRRARALSGEISRQVHPELDAAGYVLLARITETGPVRANYLAEVFGVDKSSISRQVGRLERLGLLERRVDDSDRRALLLAATPEGLRRVVTARDARRLQFRGQLASWSAADVVDLARLLHRLNEALD